MLYSVVLTYIFKVNMCVVNISDTVRVNAKMKIRRFWYLPAISAIGVSYDVVLNFQGKRIKCKYLGNGERWLKKYKIMTFLDADIHHRMPS